MTDERFRLTCYKDYLCVLPSCVFNGSPGEKDCAEPLNVAVTTKKDGRTEEPAVTVRIDGGAGHEAWLPATGTWHNYPQKIYFEQSGEHCKLGSRRKRKDEVSYKCVVSKIDEKDEEMLLAMKMTHPKIWGMIEPYLYNDTDFGLRDYTFRELAAYFIKEERWSEQKMYPYFLIETSDEVCISEYDRMSYYSPMWESPQYMEDGGRQLVQRPCKAELGGGFDKHQDSDEIDGDRNCFWDTLLASVPLTPFAPEVRDDISVLEIGCGAAVSAAPLAEFLQRYRLADEVCLYDGDKRPVQYTGVDIDKEAVEKAREINPSNFTFIAQDANLFLDARPEQTFDVILFRHPGQMFDSDFGVGSPDVWESLIGFFL